EPWGRLGSARQEGTWARAARGAAGGALRGRGALAWGRGAAGELRRGDATGRERDGRGRGWKGSGQDISLLMRVILSHCCRMVAVGAICLPLMYSGSPSAPDEILVSKIYDRYVAKQRKSPHTRGGPYPRRGGRYPRACGRYPMAHPPLACPSFIRNAGGMTLILPEEDPGVL
ncbi:hypothetical protein EJB05_44383, partial [Eragrostis curvula]